MCRGGHANAPAIAGECRRRERLSARSAWDSKLAPELGGCRIELVGRMSTFGLAPLHDLFERADHAVGVALETFENDAVHGSTQLPR
jgi:hypothetical protein